MRIAVINEVSTKEKNFSILSALENRGFDIYNVGMNSGESKGRELTYIHTGLMTGILLNLGVVEFVVGGCGTGQGFVIASMQYPNVFTGLIVDPLDAWLFSQINGGNCISLALNKGYGWAGDINLEIIFDKLFQDEFGLGYPVHRRASQKQSRERLQEISLNAHKTMQETLERIDREILEDIFSHEEFVSLIKSDAKDKELQSFILNKFV